jgi:hypothetical protein
MDLVILSIDHALGPLVYQHCAILVYDHQGIYGSFGRHRVTRRACALQTT